MSGASSAVIPRRNAMIGTSAKPGGKRRVIASHPHLFGGLSLTDPPPPRRRRKGRPQCGGSGRRHDRRGARDRSEESSVGKEWVRPCRSRWAPNHQKKKAKFTINYRI